MTKFEKAATRADVLGLIYNRVETEMKWSVIWEDEEQTKPSDEEEAFKASVFRGVLEALEKML